MRSRKTPSRFPARLGAVLAGIAFVIAAGAALLSTLGLTGASPGPAPSASIALLAVDGDPTGNSPRSVGTVEQCVSTNVGQPAQIDIVVPGPGVPADRGIGAYQFSILYDPAVIWIGSDDSDMLLAQATGSNVIPIADPKPDRNGVYESWGVDFGPSGIEPAGSSETGPGVIARITLLPQSAGVSTLTLSDVLVIDDASDRIRLESVHSATINVGQPCSTPSPGPTAGPGSTPPTGGRTPSPGPTAGPGSHGARQATGAEGPGADAPAGGHGPQDSSGTAWVPAVLATTGVLLAVLGGLSLLISYLSTSNSQGRRR